MSSASRRILVQILTTLGIALAAYLAGLHFLRLPCIGSGGCEVVINSRYGQFLGVPVGLFAVLLWLAVIYVPDRSKRGVLLVLMGGVSFVFMLLQFFVIRSFCLFCTAHALISWIMIALHGEKPSRWTAPLGLALAFSALFLARENAAARATETLPPATAESVATLRARGAGLYWLGPYNERSPALILSLDCPSCLDLLDSLTRRFYDEGVAGPALYWKTTDANRALSETFVAAVLAQESTPRDAFLAVTTLFLTHKELAIQSPDNAAKRLENLFSAADRVVHARRILDDQAAALAAAQLGQTTPLLLPPTGEPRVFFSADDLFPRAP